MPAVVTPLLSSRPVARCLPRTAHGSVKSPQWRRFLVVLAIVAVTALAFSTPRRIYDERYHLDRVDQLLAGRPWRDVFTERTPSAVGPLFPIVQSVVSRGWNDVRAHRSLVLAAAGGVLALTAFLLRAGGHPAGTVALAAGSLPFVVSALMAMTELPALLLVLAAFALVRAPGGRWSRWLLSGLALAAATLTRQNSVLLLGPLLLAWWVEGSRDRRALLVVAAPAVAAVLGLLWLWGGFVPPGQEHLNRGVMPLNAFQAACYTAVMGCLINPGFLRGIRPWLAVAAGLGLNLVFGWVREPVLLTVIPAASPRADLTSRAFFGLGAGLALAYFGGVAASAWRRRSGWEATWLVALLAVVGGCAMIAMFSTRYVVTAIPFLVLAGAERRNPLGGRIALCLAAGGVVLGLNALRIFGLWADATTGGIAS